MNIADKRFFFPTLIVTLFTILTFESTFSGDSSNLDCLPGFDQKVRLLHSSENINPCEEFADKPMLIVNTASHCGFTPQFESLEELHQIYSPRGLSVLGVPSKDFNQEASLESETAEVCRVKHGVTFTMLSTQEVTGENAHPVFKFLSMETKAPSWNFTKYLVSKEREVVERFPSHVSPMDQKVRKAIEDIL